ncbi:MAG: TonB-dependent receptor, partial [Candidatus Eisenbacteria bacterium]
MIVSLALILQLAAVAADSSARPAVSVAPIASASRAASARDSVRTRPVLTFPETVVSGERFPGAELVAPTVAVATRSLSAAAGAHVTLSEALGSIAGVHVTDYGGLGGFSTVSMRGLPSNHVAVLVDGIPLGLGTGGSFNLSALPASAIDRIEAYRGQSPLLLGVSAPAGALNLVTLAAPHVQALRLERGSYQTWDARGAFGAERGPFALQLLGSGFTTRGNFTYHDRNGTELDARDDGDSLRINNRRDVWTGLGALRWRGSDGWQAVARHIQHHRALGIPGTGAVPAANPRLVEAWSRPMLEVARASRNSWPGARVTAASETRRLRFTDTRGQLSGAPFRTDDRLLGEGFTVAIDRPARPAWLVVQGQASLRRDRARLKNEAVGAPHVPESRRWTRGATLDLELRPIGERLLIHAAKRWERYEDHLRAAGIGGAVRATDLRREIVTPQLGARLALGFGFTARGNWSESERAPDFLELFGNQGAVQGNPALLPERVTARDAGLGWRGRIGHARFEVEGWRFANEASDLIVLVRNSQSTLKPANVSRMENRGSELGAHLAVPGGVTVGGAGTWQAARDRGNVSAWRGRKLPLRPDRELHLDASIRQGWVSFGASLHDIDPNFTDRRNQTLIPRRTLIGVAATFSPPRLPLRVSLDLKNLTDDRAFDLGGYPL